MVDKVFDDLFTSGQSMSNFIGELRKVGGNVIDHLTIARTIDFFHLNYFSYHPINNHPVLIKSLPKICTM